MQNAPSVDHPVGRCAFQAWCSAGLGLVLLMAALDRLAWAVRHADLAPDPSTPVLVLLTLVWCLAAVRACRCAPQGLLRWQSDPADPAGSGWRWCQGGRSRPCAVHSGLDLGSVWLVRVVGPQGRGGPGWLWLRAAEAPSSWPDLRRAVWASRGNPEAVDRSVIFPRA